MAVSRFSQNASNQNLIAGLTKHAADIPQMTLGGQVVTNAALVQVLEGHLASSANVVTTHDTWSQAVASDRALQAGDLQLLDNLRQALRAMYKGAPTTLSDFGLTARGRTPLTTEQKLVAAAKAKATRIARGTMGPKKRAAIHGDVTGVTVTPVVEGAPPAQPAASATPAAPAKG